MGIIKDKEVLIYYNNMTERKVDFRIYGRIVSNWFNPSEIDKYVHVTLPVISKEQSFTPVSVQSDINENRIDKEQLQEQELNQK